MLLTLALKGRVWLDAHLPPEAVAADGPSELEQFLQQAGPDERMEVLRAMRAMLAALEGFAAERSR